MTPAEPEPAKPFPVESPTPAATSLMQAISQPALASTGVKLVVAMSFDESIGLANRSKQQVLESFEEGNVAWVDGKTLDLLGGAFPHASITLPNGREYQVRLEEASIRPQESRYVILPRKL
jgi:hypothetical protein